MRLAFTRLPTRTASHFQLRRESGFREKPQRPPVRYEPDPESSPENVQNQFSEHTLFAFRNLGRALAYFGYGTLIVGLVAATAFEGGHIWIEHRMRIAPDEDAERWGWEVEGWTGGERGGTSPALGFFGRHLVRAAWFSLHSNLPFDGATTISHADGSRSLGSLNIAASDLESACRYLENAIARARGQDGRVPMDKVGSDLLERHATVLERLGTRTALARAREEYIQILTGSREGDRISQSRLAVKIGRISERLGNNEAALTWWTRGIDLTSDDSSSENVARVVPPSPRSTGGNLASALSRWMQSKLPEESSPIPFVGKLITLPLRPPSSPAAQRTLVAALLSISALYSRMNQLKEAEQVQEYAISLIDAMIPTPDNTSIEPQSPGQTLHHMYLLQRKSVLALHYGEVTYSIASSSSSSGLQKAVAPMKPLTDLLTAASLSEVVAQVLTGTTMLPLPDIASAGVSSKSGTRVPHPPASYASLALQYRESPWLQTSAQSLLRDARRTALEAWDLCGVLYGEVRDGDMKALDCFERALGWAAEPGAVGDLLSETGVNAWETLWERYMEARNAIDRD